MPVRRALKMQRRKLFPQKRQANNTQECPSRYFVGTSQHPRIDPSAKMSKHNLDPLHPKFEVFIKGGQARFLPKGIWVWNKGTIQQGFNDQKLAVQRAKETKQQLDALNKQLKPERKLFRTSAYKREREILLRKITQATQEHTKAENQLRDANEWVKLAHNDKLAELKRMKKPKLP